TIWNGGNGQGTLGMVVYDKASGAPKLLTVAHNFADGKTNAASVYVGKTAYVSSYYVGNVERYQFDPGFVRDFAIASIFGNNTSPYIFDYNGNILGMPSFVGVRTLAPVIGHQVRFYDRLSGTLVHCTITAFGNGTTLNLKTANAATRPICAL